MIRYNCAAAHRPAAGKKTGLHVLLTVLLVLTGLHTYAQTEAPPPITPFQVELNDADAWFNNSSVNSYTFSTSDAINTFDPAFIVPGEDILDNAMLTDLLTENTADKIDTPVVVYDTTYFAYEGVVFTRYAQYTLAQKQHQDITIDGDVFADATLYNIHEHTIVYKDGDAIPWERDIHYFSVPATGTSIISTVSYWENTGIAESGSRKYLQNRRSVPPHKTSSVQPDVMLTLAPIPAGTEVRLTISGKQALENATVELADMHGKRVMTLPLGHTEANFSLEQTLNVASLPNGIYTVRLWGATAPVIKKLVIAR